MFLYMLYVSYMIFVKICKFPIVGGGKYSDLQRVKPDLNTALHKTLSAGDLNRNSRCISRARVCT
jgi:hypothetical protein